MAVWSAFGKTVHDKNVVLHSKSFLHSELDSNAEPRVPDFQVEPQLSIIFTLDYVISRLFLSTTCLFL